MKDSMLNIEKRLAPERSGQINPLPNLWDELDFRLTIYAQKGGKEMAKLKFLALIVVFFFIGSLTAALGENSIGVNQVKRFKGGGELQKIVKVNLQTDRRTRVQIMVTKGDKILENHKLVVGSSGVCEGKCKGAQSWGYILPEGASGKDLAISVSVHPLAGNGGPIVYSTKTTSAKDSLGFCLSAL